MEANNSITLVSCTHFKWTAQIQYRQSLPNRDEAIRYATRHGCNLIVQYYRRSGPLFDVMNDPEMDVTSSANTYEAETITTEPEPDSVGWGELLFQSLSRLFKRNRRAPDTP